MKVALLTCSEWPELSEDDQLLVESFKNHDVEVNVIPWDSLNVDWSDFDLCIIRSTWNYHYSIDKFLNWLDAIDKKGVNLWNPSSIIRWNSNKSYLKELKNQGISVVPTVWIKKNSQVNLKQIMEENNFQEVVVKPIIGASAYNIWSSTKEEADQKQTDLDEMVSKTDMLIQPLVKEIQIEGEWSFVFIGGKYSHSILKKPKEDDFRVQRRYGGTSEKGNPSQDLIKQAEKIAQLIEGEPLYARVDAVNIGGKLTLMELELIEPALFFSLDPGSAIKFVEAAIKLKKYKPISY